MLVISQNGTEIRGQMVFADRIDRFVGGTSGERISFTRYGGNPEQPYQEYEGTIVASDPAYIQGTFFDVGNPGSKAQWSATKIESARQ